MVRGIHTSVDDDTTSVNSFDGDYGQFGYDITLISGEEETGNDFANYRQAVTTGRKFNDINGDGDDEGGADPGLEGWEIRAYADLNGDGIVNTIDLAIFKRGFGHPPGPSAVGML